MSEQTTTRRSVLTSAAAVAMAGAAAFVVSASAADANASPVATDPDPIFDLIDRHRNLYAVYDERVQTTDDIDQHANKVLSDELKAIKFEIMGTAPTSLAGIHAVLCYAAERADTGCGLTCHSAEQEARFFATLAEAVEQLI